MRYIVLQGTTRIQMARKHLQTTDDWGRFVMQSLISGFFGAFLTVVFTQAMSK